MALSVAVFVGDAKELIGDIIAKAKTLKVMVMSSILHNEGPILNKTDFRVAAFCRYMSNDFMTIRERAHRRHHREGQDAEGNGGCLLHQFNLLPNRCMMKDAIASSSILLPNSRCNCKGVQRVVQSEL